MTNAEMIMRESLELMKQGILAGVDTKFTDENGEEVVVAIPEEIHTFDQWKKMGRIVKYGEHAVAKFPVWSPTKKTQRMLEENDGKLDDKEKKEARMYMRNASWFTFGQTETVEEAEKARAERKAKKTEEQKTAEPKTVTESPEPKKTVKADAEKKAETAKTEKPKKTEVKAEPKKVEVKKDAPKSKHAVCAKTEIAVGENYSFL